MSLSEKKAEKKAEKKVSFGHRDVSPLEKQSLVVDVFDRVASHYEFMNSLMSFGLQRRWRHRLVEHLRPRQEDVLVDVAGGTGEVITEWKRHGGDSDRALVVDVSLEMLNHARQKDYACLCALGEHLPLKDASADVISCVFGLRNMGSVEKALRECHRVLRPMGRLGVLEFSESDVPIWNDLYEGWLRYGLPFLGRVFANDESSYRYLGESIERFMTHDRLLKRVRGAGFGAIRCERLSGGIVTLIVATRM